MIWPQILMLVSVAGFLVGLTVYLRRTPSPPQVVAATNVQFYSNQDRENLANMTTELIAFLRENGGDGGGNGAWKKLATLGNEWNAKGGSPGNISFLVADAANAKNAVTALWDGLYGEHGIYQKYPAYHNEFEQFFPPQEQYPTQIHGLQGALADFDTAVNAVISETTPERRKNIQMALRPSSEKYVATIQQFQKHLFEATQRVERFRKKLTVEQPSQMTIITAQEGEILSMSGPIINNQGIITHGQTGGNNTVINQGPSPPRIEVVENRPIVANADATFTSVARVKVISAYPPNHLMVSAKGPSLVSLDVATDGPGTMQVVSGDNDGMRYHIISSPTGGYVVSVKTKNPANRVALDFSFD